MIPMLGVAQELKLDTKNATVEFNFVSDNVQGTVGGIDATLSLDWSDLSNSSVKGTADVATIATGTKMRDKHLRGKDYFHAEEHPKMSFTSSSVEKKGEKYVAKGSLTIKGTSKDVAFDMDMKDGVLILTTSINAADFGVSPKKADKSRVDVTVKVPTAK